MEGRVWQRLVRVVVRPAVCALLLSFLLIPYAAGLLLPGGREEPKCGMSCCREAKSCCCRKASHSDGPAWLARTQCQGGCGQPSTIAVSASPAEIAVRIELVPALASSRIVTPVAFARHSADIGFALFERPPPSA